MPQNPAAAAPPALPASRSRARLPADEVVRLVTRAGTGDDRAWNAIVDEFAGVVWAVARSHRLDHADAADVVQITFMRLVERLDSIREPERVGAWLATTARRECLSVLRDRGRVSPVAEAVHEPAADPASEPPSVLLDNERDALLWQAFNRLRARDRALLSMLAADPPSNYDEIGAALGMPKGSIGPTRARALERLRREVEDLGLSAE